MMKRFLVPLLLGNVCVAAYGRSPSEPGSVTGYMENRGQLIDQWGKPAADVRFLLHGAGFNVQLRSVGFSYDLVDTVSSPVDQFDESGTGLEENVGRTVRYHRLDLDFIGANPAPQISAELPTGPVYNFYTYGTPANGCLGIRQYERVVYADVYPGIDVAFTLGDGGSFKYDIIVHPEGDPNDIRIRISGADGTRASERGITMGTRFGHLVESIPACYWRSGETSQPVAARFVEVASDEFAVHCAQVRPEGSELVIDPVPQLLWCSYFNTIDPNTYSTLMCADTVQGRIAFGGSTGNDLLVATAGAHQGTYGGGYDDGYVGMMDPAMGLAWLTYFGGAQTDVVNALAISNGKIIVAGTTLSPTNIAYNTPWSLWGPKDGLVAKFDLATGDLELARYMGGAQSDVLHDMVLHDTLAFAVGSTNSIDSMAYGASDDPLFNGGPLDAYICAFSTVDLNLHYGSYAGGAADEQFFNVAWDGVHSVYAFGLTKSSDNIGTSGAYLEQLPYDTVMVPFMVKYEPLGARLWGSYYPWPYPAYDIEDMATMNDEAFMCGTYNQSSFNNMDLSEGPVLLPTDSSSYDPTPDIDGYNGAYVHFDSDGGIEDCTYLSGSGAAQLRGMTARNGRVYVVGHAFSPDLATCGAWDMDQSSLEGLLIRFSDSNIPDWISYFGSSAWDHLMEVDAHGDRIYAVGATNSPGLSTPDAFQSTFESPGTLLFAVFEDTCATGIVGTAGPITGDPEVCPGNTEVYSVPVVPNVLCYEWSVPDGAEILSGQGTATITVQLGNTSGWVRVLARSACRAGQPAYLNVTVLELPSEVLAPDGTMICPESSPTAVVVTDFPFVWNVGPIEDTITVEEPGPYYVILTHPSGCTTNSDTLQFMNGPVLATSIISGDPTPAGNSQVQYSATYHFGSSYVWEASGGTVTDPSSSTGSVLWDAQGSGWVAVTETEPESCAGHDTLVVQVISTGIQEAAQQLELWVHPVPVDELLSIRTTNWDGVADASVMDASGREVLRRQVTLVKGRAGLDVHALANGMYTLRMSSSSVARSAEFVVQH